MANTLIPIEERILTPEQVELLDRRRRRGQLFLVIGGQCLIVACLMTLWSGQDATYSPGWARPMVYWRLRSCWRRFSLRRASRFVAARTSFLATRFLNDRDARERCGRGASHTGLHIWRASCI